MKPLHPVDSSLSFFNSPAFKTQEVLSEDSLIVPSHQSQLLGKLHVIRELRQPQNGAVTCPRSDDALEAESGGQTQGSCLGPSVMAR